MDIYSVIETQVVAQMTPVITLTSIDVVSATSWKLWSCNTEWTTVAMDIAIDGASYKVSSFVQDEYLIVTGTVTPVQLYFQLSAPHFEYGSHRKVNIERGTVKGKKLITPMVYMPLVENDGIKKAYDSPYGFEGEIRLFFLHEFDVKKPTRIIHKTNIINPMKAMADYAMYLIDLRQDIFDDVTGTKEIERMDFGDVTIWGNKERIFNENLSGAERSFELRVEENEITCGCCQTEFSPSCLPANILINGVQSDTVASGDDFLLIVKDTNSLTVGTYNEPTKTITVPAATGGGSFTYDLFINGVDSGQDVLVDGTNITLNLS